MSTATREVTSALLVQGVPPTFFKRRRAAVSGSKAKTSKPAFSRLADMAEPLMPRRLV
ncbi:MAG: hypothetical protein Q8R72_01570 [Hylemonella sp.]|nr:hypothetical protein [Hylemonella sp.]